MLGKNPYLILNDGHRIPLLGLGVLRAAGDEAVSAVKTALQCGYRHIDTAMIYRNEAEVGQGIKESGVARSEIFLTSKLWNDDTRAGCVRQALELSLKKLDTDYLDLYLIHWPVPGFKQAYAQMVKLQQEGLIRSVGVSNFTPAMIDELREVSGVIPAVNQVECHPYLSQIDLLNEMRRRGTVLEAYSPLGGNHSQGAIRTDPVVSAIAAKHHKSPVQVLIRWQLQRSVVVLPKAAKAEHIQSNAEVFDFELDDQDLKLLRELNRDQRFNGEPDKFMHD